jgi:hypothetical protein
MANGFNYDTDRNDTLVVDTGQQCHARSSLTKQ